MADTHLQMFMSYTRTTFFSLRGVVHRLPQRAVLSFSSSLDENSDSSRMNVSANLTV